MFLAEPRVPGGTVVMALAAPLWIPSLAIGPAFLLARYPSGRIEGPWVRRFDRLARAAMVLLYLGYAASEPAVDDMVRSAHSPFGVPSPLADAVVGGVGFLAAMLAILLDGVRRSVRTRDREERIALALLWSAAVAATLMAFASPYEWTLSVAWLAVAAAIAIGVLRYRALGIQVTVLTGGDRDPFAALGRLGTPLGGEMDERSLAGVLDALRDALVVDGVAVDGVAVDGVAVDGVISAVSGTLPDEPIRIPLQFAGRDNGALLVAGRPGGAALGRSGRRVLEAVSPLIAAVLHAVQLAEELRGNQQRVVAATQAERMRLRRSCTTASVRR